MRFDPGKYFTIERRRKRAGVGHVVDIRCRECGWSLEWPRGRTLDLENAAYLQKHALKHQRAQEPRP